MISPYEYYKSENVIKRMLEYCGADISEFELEQDCDRLVNSKKLKIASESMSTEYLVGWGKKLLEERGREFESVRNYSLGWLLDNSFDVFRSVWDSKSMLFVIDVEYYSKKYPQIPYIDQEYTFKCIEPYFMIIKDILQEYGILPMIIATGQGYHFVFQVNTDSEAFDALSRIGHVEDTLLGKYSHLPEGSRRERMVSEKEGCAYDGVGKLLEYIYHKVVQSIHGRDDLLPLMVGDISVGNEKMEAISFDLSGYANPIFMRDIRLPFSTHQKHKVHPYKIGHENAKLIPIQIAVPRYVPGQVELSLKEIFELRRHYAKTAEFAGKISCRIPVYNEEVQTMVNEYLSSKLYEFHKDFDMTHQEPYSSWEYTYDKFDLSQIPPCVAHVLANPNPTLLQPTQIQTLVRVLAGKQWWHPKHIAGLIRSKYERNYGWEVDFFKYDANTWACSWVRIYAGMMAVGTDDLCDFNCISHQEKGISWAGKPYCVKPNCGYSLGSYR